MSPFFLFFSLTMSLCQWNTSFECKQLAKITTSLALYQVNNGSSEMEEEVMSDSLSSSGTSSSSSLSSSSLASDMDLDQTTQIDPVLLKLSVMMTTLNEKINGTVSDGGISWGCTPTIMDQIVVLGCCVIDVAPTLSLSLMGSATTTMATGYETVSSSPSIVNMLGIANDLVLPACKTNAGSHPTKRVRKRCNLLTHV